MIPGLVVAAGGIVRRGGRVLVVYRTKYGDCTLPKGKLKRGETPYHAAIREVQEETGYSVEVLDYAGATSYLVRGTPKVVLFWRMSAGEKNARVDPAEISAVKWLTRREAIKKLTYPSERQLVEEIWKSG